MKPFFLSLRSEFFKTRHTLAFWGAIVLPVFICFIVFTGYYLKAESVIERMNGAGGKGLWYQYLSTIMGVMGTLLLPMYLIFMTYSINNIEHKSETWKSLFSLPIPKYGVYLSKAFYTMLLVLLTLILFYSLSIILGLVLGKLEPRFLLLSVDVSEIWWMLGRIYIKLFFTSLGIISIQFFFSLLWQDFMKPMGFGFILLVTAIITIKWEYSYLIPYGLPAKTILSIQKDMLIFDNNTFSSVIYAFTFFTIGYFMIVKRSVK